MTVNELEDLLRSLGADKLRASGDKVVGCCPVHQESRPSFCAWVEGTYNCLACGSHGTLAKLVKEVHGCSWDDARKYVRRFGEYEAGAFKEHELPEYSRRFQETGAAVVPQTVLDGFAAPNWKMRDYLSRRGVGSRAVDRARLRRFAEDGRIIFVWYDGDVPRGMTTRSYLHEDDPHRGLPLLGFPKHQYVYMAAGPVTEPVKQLVVCEGEISALRVQHAGYAACALSGWKMSEAQGRMIASLCRRAVLLYDNDDNGARGVTMASQVLAPLVPTFRPEQLPPSYADPADCPLEALHRVLNGQMEVC